VGDVTRGIEVAKWLEERMSTDKEKLVECQPLRASTQAAEKGLTVE
jgi:hypothetical protein